MAQHGIKAPAIQGQLQLNDGSPSMSASDEEVFDLNIRITNTKERKRQIQVFRPSPHAQHDLANSSKQSSLSPYRTLHVAVVCHSR